MSEQLTLIERRLAEMPVAAAGRLAKFTGALLAHTNVIVGMGTSPEATTMLAGYQPTGAETKRVLQLPAAHVARWMTFSWRFLADDGARLGQLYSPDALLDFITGALDDIQFTAPPAERRFAPEPTNPVKLKPGHTYAVSQGDFAILPIYGVDEPHMCLTTPSAAQPLMVTHTLPLIREVHGTQIREYTNAPLSQ